MVDYTRRNRGALDDPNYWKRVEARELQAKQRRREQTMHRIRDARWKMGLR